MSETPYRTKQAILARAREAEGKTFGEIDQFGRLAKASAGKGKLGLVIEESWFGYKPNSKDAPDFEEARVELKVTPFVRNRKGEIRAKERLVCNILDYMEEWRASSFYESSFWRKCETMLIMAYEAKKGVAPSALSIHRAFLNRFSEEDLQIIEEDWRRIIGKIRAGKAHEITETETNYLAACPKGSSASSLRNQPFAPILAMQRAYSLKSSYMTIVLRAAFAKKRRPLETVVRDAAVLRTQDFERYVWEHLRPFFGKTTAELGRHFGVRLSSKQHRAMLIAAIFGVRGQLAKTEEFQKANVCVKTVRLTMKGIPHECMSFRAFRFRDVAAEPSWEESDFGEFLRTTKFFFAVFQDVPGGGEVLRGARFWYMPPADWEEARKVWERTRQRLREGLVITERKTKRKTITSTNLPKESENPVAHVRPHARKKAETDILPDGRHLTKQCFWLNKAYVAQIVRECHE